MGIAVNLDAELVGRAKSMSTLQSRSTAKQIEYWAKLGRIADENPDLTGEDVKGILLGLQDFADGNLKSYKRGIL